LRFDDVYNKMGDNSPMWRGIKDKYDLLTIIIILCLFSVMKLKLKNQKQKDKRLSEMQNMQQESVA